MLSKSFLIFNSILMIPGEIVVSVSIYYQIHDDVYYDYTHFWGFNNIWDIIFGLDRCKSIESCDVNLRKIS